MKPYRPKNEIEGPMGTAYYTLHFNNHEEFKKCIAWIALKSQVPGKIGAPEVMYIYSKNCPQYVRDYANRVGCRVCHNPNYWVNTDSEDVI